MKISRFNSAKVCFVGVLLALTSLNAWSQPVFLEPGDASLKPEAVKTGDFEWGWFRDARADIGKQLVSVRRSGPEVVIDTQKFSKELDVNESSSLVLNAKTLEPLRYNYKGGEVSYNLSYGAKVKGTRTIFETNKKESLDEALPGKFFAKESLPFVISSLPLSPGYAVTLPVISFDSSFKPVYHQYKVSEVSELVVEEAATGKMDCWKVTVLNKKQGHEHVFYIDKPTRRILREDFLVPGMLVQFNTFDRYKDVNPIKAVFNLDETLAMISKGRSSIQGQAFAKAFRQGGARQGTQYAPVGSAVLLIPNTPYFKEWADYNLALYKKSGTFSVDWGGLMGPQQQKTIVGLHYPIPPQVQKAMLTTTVQDEEGHFTFSNLKAGEYLVFVSFRANKYSHTTRTPNGYSIFVNNDGTGSAVPIEKVEHWMTPGNIRAYKYVRINQDGDVVSETFSD